MSVRRGRGEAWAAGPAGRIGPVRSQALLCLTLLALLVGGSAWAQAAGPGVAPAAVAPPAAGIPPTPSAPLPTQGPRTEIEQAWFGATADLQARARITRTAALELGAPNVEAAARALLAAAARSDDPDVALELSELALELAPDLPVVHMGLARAHFGTGDFPAAAADLARGLAAIPRSLEATLWLAGSLLALLAAVLAIGSLLFIVSVGLGCFRHAAHDLGDLVSSEMPDFASVALLGSLVLLPLVFGEGIMGLAVALFAIGFGYGGSGHRRALALAAVLLVLGLQPVTRMAGKALTALEADPVATAAHAVARGMASPAELERLRQNADDPLAGAALAFHARHTGNDEAALEILQRLVEQSPLDVVSLNNVANLLYRGGDAEGAIELYERAAGIERSAPLMFNLSQVYARSFQMEEFEFAMQQGQTIDAGAVEALSNLGDPGFVADLPFALEPVRTRMISNASGDAFVRPVAEVLMPGRLGDAWFHAVAAFALAAVLALSLASRWEHSSVCIRCGRRICARCDGSVWNSEVCDGCHHLFHRPETTDPQLRMTRLAALRRREKRIERLAFGVSLVLPGAAGLLARRPDLAFLGVLFFVATAVSVAWSRGVVPDPIALGGAAPLAFAIVGSVTAFAYLVVAGRAVVIRRNA